MNRTTATTLAQTFERASSSSLSDEERASAIAGTTRGYNGPAMLAAARTIVAAGPEQFLRSFSNEEWAAFAEAVTAESTRRAEGE